MLPPHSKSSGKVGDVNILAVSVGSSSIKLRVIDDDDTTLATKDHRDLGPGVSRVACFDTSFPTEMPARAATYAVPREWRRSGASGVSVSMGSAMTGPADERPSSWAARGESLPCSPCTSVPARHLPRSRADTRSTPPWDSLHWKGS